MDFFWGWLLMLAAMAVVWVFSVGLRDASLVDRFWGLGFVLVGLFWWWLADQPVSAGWMLIPVALWGLRLSGYITWRNWGHGEDRRYTAMREGRSVTGFALRSLVMIFWLQASLLVVIALPIFAAVRGGEPLLPVVWAGLFVWIFGFLYEAVADAQLHRFRQDPGNRGRIMNRGLWRYSRHPNYFGEIVVWVGFGIIALGFGAWWSIPSVFLMAFLLVRVSGVRLLDEQLSKSRPGYREYCEQTPALIPRPPSNSQS
jgi:steroid 5-alpha reductase family enzyme